MFEDMELNPMIIGLSLLAGIVSIIVMSKVEVGIIYKIGSFIGTTILSYFIIGKIFDN